MKKAKSAIKYIGLEKESKGIRLFRHKRTLLKSNFDYICTLDNWSIKSKSPKYENLPFACKAFIIGYSNVPIAYIKSIEITRSI